MHPMYRDGVLRRKTGPVIVNKNSTQDRLIEELQGKFGISRSERRRKQPDDWLTDGVIVTSKPQHFRPDGAVGEVDKVGCSVFNRCPSPPQLIHLQCLLCFSLCAPSVCLSSTLDCHCPRVTCCRETGSPSSVTSCSSSSYYHRKNEANAHRAADFCSFTSTSSTARSPSSPSPQPRASQSSSSAHHNGFTSTTATSTHSGPTCPHT